MFLLHVIIIPYEFLLLSRCVCVCMYVYLFPFFFSDLWFFLSIFFDESLILKMRNSHFLLKVLNSYSLARCNQLCLTKFPKSPITRICSKIPSPCSVNKIPIIPHYLHLLQNFISFLNFLSPSLKFYFPATRDLFISLLSFSHPHLLLSFLKEIFSFFLLLGLQFP